MSDEQQAPKQEYGIKETKELLVGVNELALELVKVLKDGAQVSDIGVIIADLQNNQDFAAKLKAAHENVNLVPAEIKDLNLLEGVELVTVQAAYVPKILEAAKKA